MLLLLACAPDSAPTAAARAPTPIVSAQRVRAELDTDGGHLAMHVLVTDADGAAVDCSTGDLSVTIEVSDSSDSGPWSALPVEDTLIRCAGAGAGDLALVVDNSGSELGYIDALTTAAQTMADGVLAAGGRTSVVRVSTNVTDLTPLSGDPAVVDAALDALHISNGWTALWDGVRHGRETLAAAPAETLTEFCDQSSRLGVVAFTDGQDNNSADQQDYDHDAYPGDGIDTTADDLVALGADGSTPIYTVGLGGDVDTAALDAIAAGTGGRALPIDSVDEIGDVFSQVSGYFGATSQVCADVPDATCGTLWVRSTVTWSGFDGDPLTSTTTSAVTLDCDGTPTGNSALVLLTLQSPGISADTAQTLAENAVTWAGGVPDPRVLVVLDDNHHGEDADDASYIANLLDASGYDVTYQEEPGSGLRLRDLRGYDVVWFSNPGYPMDDGGSFEALESYASRGGGVVLQGDDMAWSWTSDFSTRSLTHVNWLNNGTSFCGHWTDNESGSDYLVTLGAGHPLTSGLEGASFRYGNDIDTTSAAGEGETVVATATLADDDGCDTVPVIVAWSP